MFLSNFNCYVLSKQEIALMEDELNEKNELIKKQEHLIQEWKKELSDQLEKHNIELNRV
jgi:mediator of RNA polymerase II transcription subunit 28